MMVSEVGDEGAWIRAFEAAHRDKFNAPTAEGIDFPSLGVYQAWNDRPAGILRVGTCAAAPDRRGAETSWRVTNLPNAADVSVRCDGEPFNRVEIVGSNVIRLNTTVDTHAFEIFTRYRGAERVANPAHREAKGVTGAMS